MEHVVCKVGKGLKCSIRVLERKKKPNKYNISFAKLETSFKS
jgi:hypothetical protein